MEINDIAFRLIQEFDSMSEEKDSVTILVVRGEEGDLLCHCATKMTGALHLAGTVIHLLMEMQKIAQDAQDTETQLAIKQVHDFATANVFGEMEVNTVHGREKYVLNSEGRKIKLEGQDKSKLN